MAKNNNARLIKNLRKLAKYLEKNPLLEPITPPSRYDIFVSDKDEFIKQGRLLGSVEKKAIGDSYFILRTKAEITGFPIELTIEREKICERIEVKKLVPEQIIPAKPEEHVPEHEEVTYKWHCPESLFNEKREEVEV